MCNLIFPVGTVRAMNKAAVRECHAGGKQALKIATSSLTFRRTIGKEAKRPMDDATAQTYVRTEGPSDGGSAPIYHAVYTRRCVCVCVWG